VVPAASGVDLTSCHEERKKYGVRGASALKPLSERKTETKRNNKTNREGKEKEARQKTERERNYER
jgi:hypothetical protein